MDRQELITKLTLAWKRAFLPYPYSGYDELHAVYLDEALTGFAFLIEKPSIGEFNGEKCVLVPLSLWMHLKNLANTTVTPFRLVAVGKDVIVGAWQAHSGLKYAVRNAAIGPCTVHIPISEFKTLK